MVFSSTVFLFGFLPLFLLIYYIKPNNITLLLFSLLFYSWGEPVYVCMMIFSTILDYTCGRLVEKYRGTLKAKIFLIISVFTNLGLLVVFKYSGFVVETINNVFNTSVSIGALPLPIGISFYTFQTMSYTIDVYRGDVKAQKNIITFGAFVSLFPQLIAGPIVRYKTIAEQLESRRISIDNICDGVERFIIGFIKKVIFANQMAQLADTILQNPDYKFLVTWLGAVAYMLQIYYDFSGYSDMAIGLGKMLGFRFDENFNYPYESKSITEFWKKWHISLSSWFRDYVYIPLGGNRVGRGRQVFNMLIVWSLTGIWHGASWNFVIWGLYYFILLVLEKYVFKRVMKKIPVVFKWIFTALLVLLGWVIFYYDNLSELWGAFGSLFSFSVKGDDFNIIKMFLTSYAMYMIPAIIFQFPVFRKFRNMIFTRKNNVVKILYYVGLLAVGFIAVCFLVKSTYNPFIYFRF